MTVLLPFAARLRTLGSRHGLVAALVVAATLAAPATTHAQAMATPPAPAAIARAAVQPPEQFFGFRMGTDGRLASWGQIERYFEHIAATSDRVELITLGPTTEGRRMIAAVVSSPANMARLENIRRDSLRLADPRRLSAEEARHLAATQPAVVAIGCSIHATEIGATQTANELLHDLATTRDPALLALLDRVVVVVIPSLNPDGHALVVDWFERTRGTSYEGAPMPWLYHKYAGHDINRDAFMLNLAENRALANFFYRTWHPQVFLTLHQMGARGARFFVPPNYDPIDPNYDPLIWRTAGLLGHAMALALERDNRKGVVQNALFDYYWPGYEDSAPIGHNTVCLLTEAASVALALPLEIRPSDLATSSRGLPSHRPQINFPNPWPGGTWRLRDIVDYELSAVRGLLHGVERYRQEIIENIYAMGRRAIAAGEAGGPFAFVIPPDQHDPHATARLENLLIDGAVDVQRALEPFRADGREYPAGSRVVLMAQPFRAYAKTLLERQQYPVRQVAPTIAPERPNHVAGWTLPLQMGVTVETVERWFAVPPMTRVERAVIPAARIDGERRPTYYLVDARGNGGAMAAARLLRAHLNPAFLLTDMHAPNADYPAGSLVVAHTKSGRAVLETIARDLGLRVTGMTGRLPSPVLPLQRARTGLYKPWTESIDEGWTRLVLERYEQPFTTLTDHQIRAGNLRASFDAIVLPDMPAGRLRTGHRHGTVPPEYAGGLGESGVRALAAFVKDGGTVVCLDSSCELMTETLDLPVRDVLGSAPAERFFCPGSILGLDVVAANPLTFGMPERTAAFFAYGSAYEISDVKIAPTGHAAGEEYIGVGDRGGYLRERESAAERLARRRRPARGPRGAGRSARRLGPRHPRWLPAAAPRAIGRHVPRPLQRPPHQRTQVARSRSTRATRFHPSPPRFVRPGGCRLGTARRITTPGIVMLACGLPLHLQHRRSHALFRPFPNCRGRNGMHDYVNAMRDMPTVTTVWPGDVITSRGTRHLACCLPLHLHQRRSHALFRPFPNRRGRNGVHDRVNAMRDMPTVTPVCPGDVVTARGTAWKVTHVRQGEDCAAVSLTQLGHGTVGARERVLLSPFDRLVRHTTSNRLRRAPRRRCLEAICHLATSLRQFDALETLTAAAIHVWPWQVEPALALVCGYASRLLIADHVGLGKTVQAGLILAELAKRGRAPRALVLVPASLRDQWHEELTTKFNLQMRIVDAEGLAKAAAELPLGTSPWTRDGVSIVSVDFARQPDVAASLTSTRWPLVIVDEAHVVGAGTGREAVVGAVAARAARVVLLTATPHDGDPSRFDALCDIGRVGNAADLLVFRRTRRDAGMESRRRTRVRWVTPSPLERRLHEMFARYASTVRRERGHDGSTPGPHLAMALLAKRLASSSEAFAHTVRRRMLLLEAATTIDPPQLTLPFDDGDEATAKSLATPGLFHAARERAWLGALHTVATRAAATDTKQATLVRFLRRVGEPAVVFSEYVDTLMAYARALTAHWPTAVLHGGQTDAARAEALAAFRSGRVRLLLATDAAGTGLNLQATARLVLTIEMPWNPNRLEQRAGRVDRLGQHRRVHVRHLVWRQTLEERLLERLLGRVQRIRDCLGDAGAGLDAWLLHGVSSGLVDDVETHHPVETALVGTNDMHAIVRTLADRAVASARLQRQVRKHCDGRKSHADASSTTWPSVALEATTRGRYAVPLHAMPSCAVGDTGGVAADASRTLTERGDGRPADAAVDAPAVEGERHGLRTATFGKAKRVCSSLDTRTTLVRPYGVSREQSEKRQRQRVRSHRAITRAGRPIVHVATGRLAATLRQTYGTGLIAVFVLRIYRPDTADLDETALVLHAGMDIVPDATPRAEWTFIAHAAVTPMTRAAASAAGPRVRTIEHAIERCHEREAGRQRAITAMLAAANAASQQPGLFEPVAAAEKASGDAPADTRADVQLRLMIGIPQPTS